MQYKMVGVKCVLNVFEKKKMKAYTFQENKYKNS